MAWRAFIASLSAARSSSSLSAARSRSSFPPLRTWPTSPEVYFCSTLTESRKGTRPAQPVQATGPLRADAADRDAKLRVDFRVRTRRIADEHGQQLLATGR